MSTFTIPLIVFSFSDDVCILKVQNIDGVDCKLVSDKMGLRQNKKVCNGN